MSLFSFKTEKLLAVAIDIDGTVTPIARKRGSHPPTLNPVTANPAPLPPQPYTITFPVPDYQPAVLSHEPDDWQPYYDFANFYVLNDSWPLGRDDLPYNSTNDPTKRRAGDSVVTLTLDANQQLTLSSHAIKPKVVDLRNSNFKRLFVAVRMPRDVVKMTMNITDAAGALLAQEAV